MLFNDSGANGGVAYDNKHTTNSTDSNREVTIGNSGKFAALGDDAIKLKDLPDDNVPLDVPGHVSIAEDIPITMVVTGAATLETGVAPMESFSKILKSLGLIQCKTDPCLFYLFDRYGNLEAMVVAFCDDCIATTGREWWVTRLKIGILYDPQNTEDVKIYSATVPYNGNGTVVSACPCSDYDATVDVCSAYHTFDDGWITVYTKKKKEGDPLGNKGMSQGPRKVKDFTRIHGIEPVKEAIPVLLGAQSLHAVKLIMTDGDSQEMSQVDYAISTHFVNAVHTRCGWHLVDQGWRRNCKGLGYRRGKDDAAKRQHGVDKSIILSLHSIVSTNGKNSNEQFRNATESTIDSLFQKPSKLDSVVNFTRDEVEIALKNAKNTVPVSMSQEIHLPEEPLIDVCAGHETEHMNTHLDNNDNILMESTSLETDCIDFGSRALHHEDVAKLERYNAYDSIMPRAKELVSLVDASKSPHERGLLVEEALDKIIFTEKANMASEKPPPKGSLVSGVLLARCKNICLIMEFLIVDLEFITMLT
ncbi:hypothetical protein MHU86_12854 [Fragilaria crotonensis]|nr:hypothetical protein MHU86_12854 [Fragilaria crotonensis]